MSQASPGANKKDIAAFFAKAKVFDSDECLLWPFRVQTRGYGIYYDGEYVLAHRRVCSEAHGLPDEGMEAAHSCGTRLCCNSGHLSWKTHADNLEDRRDHGTLPQGESHYGSILTEEDVRHIKSVQRVRGVGAALAREFGVHPCTIYSIWRGQSWKHLT